MSTLLQFAPNGDSEKSGIHTQNNGDEGTEFWPALYGYRLKITDTLLVVFTALLCGATIFLYLATRDLVEGAENTAVRQLRAYVSVNASIRQVGNGQIPVAKLIIKNFGQTPAYELTQESGIAIGQSFDSLSTPTPLGQEKTKASLYPTDHNNASVRAPRPMTNEEWQALQAGDLTLWVYGTLSYLDAFKNRRTKRFRYMIGGAVGMDGTRMAICPDGNDED